MRYVRCFHGKIFVLTDKRDCVKASRFRMKYMLVRIVLDFLDVYKYKHF